MKTAKKVAEEGKKVAEQAEEPQPRRKSWRFPFNTYWLLLGAGIGSLVLGVWVGSFWMASPDAIALGFLTIVLFIAGGILIRRQIKHRSDIIGGAVVNIGQASGADKGKVGKNGDAPNSLNIYAAYDADVKAIVPQRIVFENVYNPMGQPQRCLNTNKDYHVHIWDLKKSQLMPFTLTDRKYTDPSILARYLGLPAQRKYLRNRESLMRLIGPGLLVVGVLAAFVTIIALSGG